MFLRSFGFSFAVTTVALVVAIVYGGWNGLFLAGILGILEVSLSFDNAVINATVLERMSEAWQRIFLTVGIVIAVFGMRLVFPLAVVWIAAELGPVDAVRLALHPPAGGADHFANGDPSYAAILQSAHPQIAAFGGMFLLTLFLTYILTGRDTTWLSRLERPLARMGQLDGMVVITGGLMLLVTAETIAPDSSRATVLSAGVLGVVVYLAVDGLGRLFHHDELDGDNSELQSGRLSTTVRVTGRAAFFLFLYLEVLDASFSFDGVIGAFAITADPVIILLGLGCIGAMFVRSLTIYLVRRGTLGNYRYLEHGAHWAIGALAVILLLSIGHEVSDVVTGLIGVALIGASAISSVIANRRDAAIEHAELHPAGDSA